MKNPVTSISTNGTGLRLAEKHYEVCSGDLLPVD